MKRSNFVSYSDVRGEYQITTASPQEKATEWSSAAIFVSANANSSGQTDINDNRASRPRALPNLHLIGVEKGGTTALEASLTSMEKSICGGLRKEVHFFDQHLRRSRNLTENIDWYEQHYIHNCTATQKFLLDATPATFRLADTFYQFYNRSGILKPSDLKLLVSLREPVSRELSQYNMKVNMCTDWETIVRKGVWCNDVVTPNHQTQTVSIKPFRQFIEEQTSPKCQDPLQADPKSWCRGHYYPYLQRWFELFDRKQILVLSYDEFKVSPQMVLQRIHDFLDLPRDTPYSLERKWENHGAHKLDIPTCEEQKLLHSLYNVSNQKLYQLLEENPGLVMEQRPFPHFQLGECSRSSNGTGFK